MNENEKSSISPLDRIFKAVFSNLLQKIQITSYESKIRELKKENTELKRIVAHDSLTGALSFVEFIERVKYFLSLFKRFSHKNGEKQYFSIVFIDIDDFKEINDTHGHDAGDSILINLVSFLREQLRDCDLVARKSGDEFLLFLEGSDLVSSSWVMKNIQSRLSHSLLSTGDYDIQVNFSFGVASTSEGMTDLDELIKEADRNMYKQKNAKK